MAKSTSQPAAAAASGGSSSSFGPAIIAGVQALVAAMGAVIKNNQALSDAWSDYAGSVNDINNLVIAGHANQVAVTTMMASAKDALQAEIASAEAIEIITLNAAVNSAANAFLTVAGTLLSSAVKWV